MPKKGARGEGYLTVDGEGVAVLYTNRALANLEVQLGRSIVRILTGLQGTDVSIADLAVMLRIGLEAARHDAGAAGKPLTEQQAWDILDAVGFLAALTAVSGAISDVMTYKPEGAVEDPPA